MFPGPRCSSNETVVGASRIRFRPCKLVFRSDSEGLGRDPGRKHRPATAERSVHGNQWSWDALGRPCSPSGCEGYRARGRVCAPPTWAEARARSPSFPVLRLIHRLRIGYDCFRQPSTRVRMPRSARAHKLDTGARGRYSSTAVNVDVTSPYLCSTYPYSSFWHSRRGCVARCERAATATATTSTTARSWWTRG